MIAQNQYRGKLIDNATICEGNETLNWLANEVDENCWVAVLSGDMGITLSKPGTFILFQTYIRSENTRSVLRK